MDCNCDEHIKCSNDKMCTDDSSSDSDEGINYHGENKKKRTRPLIGEEILSDEITFDEDDHENCICSSLKKAKLLEKKNASLRFRNFNISHKDTIRANHTKRLRRPREIRYSEHMSMTEQEPEFLLPPTGYQIRHNLTGNEIDTGVDSSSDEEYKSNQGATSNFPKYHHHDELMTRKLTGINQKNNPPPLTHGSRTNPTLENDIQPQYSKPSLAIQFNGYRNETKVFNKWKQDDNDSNDVCDVVHNKCETKNFKRKDLSQNAEIDCNHNVPYIYRHTKS